MENRDKMRIATLTSLKAARKAHSSDGLWRRLVPFRASQTLVGYEGSTKRRQRRLMGLSARQQRIQKRAATGLTDKIQARRYRRIFGEIVRYPAANWSGKQTACTYRPLRHADERFLKFYGSKKVGA